jgi:hypothetical protein
MNHRRMGITLMIAGLLAFIIGLWITTKSTNDRRAVAGADAEEQMENLITLATADGVLTPNEENKLKEKALQFEQDPEAFVQKARQIVADSTAPSEAEIVDQSKKKGDAFESFVVSRLDEEHWTIVEWAGDKFDNGRFAETTLHPDLKVQLNTFIDTTILWIECKYRTSAPGGKVSISYPDQPERYRKYQSEFEIPVYVALGIGGTPSKPKDLFLIPLDSINDVQIRLNEIQEYSKPPSEMFFYDADQKRWR